MAEITTLDALQAFHQELLSTREGRANGADFLSNDVLVQNFEKQLEKLWSRPPRSDQSRNQVKSGELSSLWMQQRARSNKTSGRQDCTGWRRIFRKRRFSAECAYAS